MPSNRSLRKNLSDWLHLSMRFQALPQRLALVSHARAGRIVVLLKRGNIENRAANQRSHGATVSQPYDAATWVCHTPGKCRMNPARSNRLE